MGLPSKHRFVLLLVLLFQIPQSSLSVQECGIYLAPSAIPGAGLGMYAGNVAYEQGDLVTYGDIVIPVFELEWHNGHRRMDFLWDEYVWSSDMFIGMDEETEDLDWIHVASGGMGAAVNCMLPLVNVQDNEKTFTVGNSGVSSQNPGIGAFTPYHSRRFEATTRIEPGTELYASYGEEYFKSRPSVYGYLPMGRNYRIADKMLTKYRDVVNNVASSLPASIVSTSASQSLVSDLWTLLLDQPSIWTESRTLQALPPNSSMVEPILQNGGTSRQHYNNSIRDLSWLEEHGQCMDNIKDGVSTNPYAGRGAFANRFIPNGGLVSPAPLIHIPYRKVLNMYKPRSINGFLRRDIGRLDHHQLILNYCFGHKNSTVLLCPYGLLTTLINHSKEPNAKIQWSKDMRHPEWKKKPVTNWGQVMHAGLSFDYVALRDIEEGEEIFIDYGDAWEAAWQEHVGKFNEKPPRPDYYAPSYELNREVDLRLVAEAEGAYSSQGVSLYCRENYLATSGIDLSKERSYEVEVWDGEEPLHLCTVLARTNDESYIAEIYSCYEENGMTKIETHEVLFDIPRDAFFFRDEPYERDHHRSWSFRHEMMIPDSMFPTAWKNVMTKYDGKFRRTRRDEVDKEDDGSGTGHEENDAILEQF